MSIMNVHHTMNTMQPDESFLSLLSSQRELLNQLNMENALRRTEPQHLHQMPVMRANHNHHHHHQNHHNYNRRGISTDPRVLTNRGIVDRRASLDMMLSKRFSLGMGTDSQHRALPTYYEASPLDFSGHLDAGHGHFHAKFVQDRKLDKFVEDFSETIVKRNKKRRLSSLGLGFMSSHSAYYDDPLKVSRMNSLHMTMRDINRVDMDDPSDDESEFGGTENIAVYDNLNTMDQRIDQVVEQPAERHRPKVDPVELKRVMEAFNSSMEQTQKSQVAIHDWDRKMGLKRSHSKTMRMSSRSRKKLRSIMKKEINALGSKV